MRGSPPPPALPLDFNIWSIVMIQHHSAKQAAFLLISLINITFVDIVNFMERSLKFSLKCTCQDTHGECVGYLQ